jgi:hypothetical protein
MAMTVSPVRVRARDVDGAAATGLAAVEVEAEVAAADAGCGGDTAVAEKGPLSEPSPRRRLKKEKS